MPRYVLTGTSGNLGSQVLQKILEKKLISPTDLIISSSNPNQLSAITKQYGIEARYGDFKNRESLKQAFAGADVMFLVSHPSPGIERVELHKNAIEAARDAGVKTVVYTSMMYGGETGLKSVIGVQQGHIHTVNYLAQSGIDHIIIREGVYAQYWEYFAATRAGIEFDMFGDNDNPFEWVIPNDGAIALVDWTDLAEGTAIVLAEHEKYVGQTLRFTGPRATTISDIAKLVEKKTGRKVDLKLVGRDKAIHYHFGYVSDPFKRKWIEEQWTLVYEGLANGEAEVVDPTLERVLGRPPRGMEEMADELLPSR